VIGRGAYLDLRVTVLDFEIKSVIVTIIGYEHEESDVNQVRSEQLAVRPNWNAERVLEIWVPFERKAAAKEFGKDVNQNGVHSDVNEGRTGPQLKDIDEEVADSESNEGETR